MKMPAQVFSFDVFDTCVSRNFAYPRDLFFELGTRLAPQNMSERDINRFAKIFQQSRVRAEKRAYRIARPAECANIFDIYLQFNIPQTLEITRDAIIDAEIALERESIYPIPEMVDEIDQIRLAGHMVIFVSDMYLPASMLGPILCRLGVMRETDKLFVSCDAGLTKRSGNLFRHVMDHERLKAANIIHIGDNHRSDILAARRLGITTRHFDKAHLSNNEKKIISHGGGTFTTSTLAALSRKSRLTAQASEKQVAPELCNLLHSTISPLLLAFVQWVLDEARKNGTKRLYFVARDGQILYKIATELMHHDGSIELRYLYGSRKAWLAPSITPDSMGWMSLVAMSGQKHSYPDILSRMSLDEAAQLKIKTVLEIENDDWHAPLSQQKVHDFLHRILANPDASCILMRATNQARRTAIQYLTQEGLLDNKPWALVDTGWSLNSQAALKRILSEAKAEKFEPLGFYLALSSYHLSPDEAGHARSFIADSGSIFARRALVFEHCFTPATHESTRSYEYRNGSVVPVFTPEIRSNSEINYALKLHEIAQHQAHLFRVDEGFRKSIEASRAAIISNVERFISNPLIQEAKLMLDLGTVADLRHEKSFVQPLCKALEFRDLYSLLERIISKKRTFSNPPCSWIEGSSVLSPIYIRTPIRIMLFGDTIMNRLKKWSIKQS